LPRFYFHVSAIDDMFPDEEGMELADLAAAHDCAMRLMHRTMLFDPEQQDWRGWMIKIADAKSRTLLTLLYPARKPVPRKTFGLRTGLSRIPLLGCVGCMVLLGLASHSAAASSLSCAKSGAAFTSVYSSGDRHEVVRPCGCSSFAGQLSKVMSRRSAIASGLHDAGL
jgi:hypothetical protein